MMTLDDFVGRMLPAIEASLRQAVKLSQGSGFEAFHKMMAYHLGWEGENSGPQARGKRIRSLLLLLTAEAAWGSWETALPASAAVELIHNFSLIHDDIEDDSPLRRGRKTLWKLWGVPQAINTGDAMFSLAHLAILALEKNVPADTVLKSARILQETCLELTRGQFLDMTFEALDQVSLEEYWQMVNGKTAALLSACTEIGALCAGASPENCGNYRDFGCSLGMAFQAEDDLLGIWGDAALTGKSNQSDLLTRKKTLPVLFGLSLKGPFAERWKEAPIQAEDVPGLALLLENEGAREYTRKITEQMTAKALHSLSAAQPKPEAGNALETLAMQLVNRKG